MAASLDLDYENALKHTGTECQIRTKTLSSLCVCVCVCVCACPRKKSKGVRGKIARATKKQNKNTSINTQKEESLQGKSLAQNPGWTFSI